MRAAPSLLDVVLAPLHRWVWSDPERRARKLFRFSATEADGSHDLSRAAEITHDALLRRLYLRHAQDEQRHADLFRARAGALRAEHPARGAATLEANWLAPGERGLDDLRVVEESDESLLAFLHLSEQAAAGRFVLYQRMLVDDEATRAVFGTILEDEEFHMSYTRKQLYRISPRKAGLRLWQARGGRLWKAWLRIATALADVLGTLLLLFQYFVVLPPFALLARRSLRKEPAGFHPARPRPSLESQY